MIKTFALVAYLALNPGQTDTFVLDTGLSHIDCLIAISEPTHEVQFGDGAVLIIEGEDALACEAE